MGITSKKALDKANDLKNKKKNKSDSNKNSDYPRVFGSFGLDYPVSGIELDRSDGVTLINSNPDVRVFVCGGELTKDVISVNVGKKLNDRGTCSIQIANPRGKYNITINDLVSDDKNSDGGLWREDKSIQATYDYDWIKKQIPDKFAENSANVNAESKWKKRGDAILGKQISSTISSVASGIKNINRARGKGFTQMLFEVKKASNMAKSVGETVFDYRDPVYVFMKGRFSSYWYFAFSGFIEGIDDSYAYGNSQTITLTCHDVAGYLQRVRFLQQGAFLQNANLEGSRQNTNLSRITNIFNKPVGTFTDVVKTVMFAADKKFTENVQNTHFSVSRECQEQEEANLVKEPYKVKNEYYSIFRDTHKFDTVHDDDISRDNTGKQFREFKLINSTAPSSTEKIEILTVDDVGFHENRATFSNKAKATNVLTSKLQEIDNIYKKDPNVFWTVVGHCALVGSKTYLVNKETGAKTEFDFGQKYTTYLNGYYNSQYDCIDIPAGVTGFPDGHGYTLSQKRAEATKELMVSIAESKFKDIVTLIKSLNVTSVGNAEPRDLGKKKSNKSSLTKEQLKALSDAHPTNPKNTVNMYVEIIPSTTQISVQEEVDDTVDFNAYFKDPHLLKFSPLSGLYYQLNDIEIDTFTYENLEVYYNTSVRYWLMGPGTDLDPKQLFNPDNTGWKHTHGFGVCGIHPALTYGFIDNFEILPDIHKVTINKSKELDGATLTPIDIIKEHMIGVGTELTPLGNEASGFQKNYFRPRIFVVKPKRFKEREREYTFTELTVDKEDSQSTWEVLKRLVLDYEYTLYSSPMGDLFLEPLLHDAHPLEFSPKIEDRSVAPRKYDEGKKEWAYEGVEIYFRTEINTNSEPIIGYRRDYAYAFNTKANHPFFIANKDIIRVTDTIKPENLMSHVIVEGSFTGQNSGLIEGAVSSAGQGAIPFLDFQGEVRKAAERIKAGESFDDINKNDNFNVNIGFYLANGFLLNRKEDQLKVDTASNKYKSLHDELRNTYAYKLKNELFQKRSTSTLKSLLESATSGVIKLASDNNVIYRDSLKKIIEKYADNKEYIDKSIPDIVLRNTDLTYQQMTVLKNIAPQVYDAFQKLVIYEEKKSENKNAVLPRLDILKAYDITSVGGNRGLLEITPERLLNIEYNTNPTVDEKVDAFIKLIDPDLALDGTTQKAFLNDFLILVEVIALADTSSDYAQFKDTNLTLVSLKRKFNNLTGISGYLTKGDIKKYEELQIYNPAKDYLSKYGWNPGPRVRNIYINNGAEAEVYAKVLFDKINSNAFNLNCDIIGRPELMLNRPYYNEYKSTIGLCNEYSLTYSFGAFFTSNVKLNYLRRNAITYNYTEGNIDKITTIFDANSDKARLNSFFNKKAINYLKSLHRADKLDSRLDLLGAPIASTAKAVIKEVGRIRDKKEEVERDAIYVAHDWVGHLSADNKIIDSTIKKAKVTSSEVSDPRYISQLDGFIITNGAAETIRIKNKKLHNSFILLQDAESRMKSLQEQLDGYIEEKASIDAELKAKTDEIASLDLDDPSLVRKRNKLQREWDELAFKANDIYSKEVSATKAEESTRKAVEKLIFQIYGSPGAYNPKVDTRTASFNKESKKGLMYDLYTSLPEKDLNKQILRDYYKMVDDVYFEKESGATVKNFESSVPLYFVSTKTSSSAST